MNKCLISFFVFALIGAFTILRGMGTYIFVGYLIGMAILHLGIWKKKGLIIILGVIITILSWLVPSFMGLLFRFAV